MNRQSISRALAMLPLMVILLISSGLASGQDVDLLANPGFEDPFTDQGGEPPRQVAEGWTAWHIPASEGAPTFQNQQPEYLPVRPDTIHIRSGDNAQLITAFFATYTAGIYQEVSGVSPETELTFSAYAYVWSSAFDDQTVSENDGDVLVQVGIDPNGGTDPTSADIVWSQAEEVYDAWTQYTVTAPAQADTVSVWLRAVAGAPVRNNNVYLDDAALSVVGAEATEPSVPTAVAVEPTAVSTDEELIEATAVVSTAEVAAPVATEATEAVVAPLPTATQEVVQPTVPPTAGPTVMPTQRATVDPNVFLNTITHVVQRGDTVQRLATLYGSTTEAIITANDLNDNSLIFVGQNLLIPVRLPPIVPINTSATAQSAPDLTNTPLSPQAAPTGILPTPVPVAQQTYMVQYGDTLGSIARRFNTTVGTLAQLNGIVNPDRILLGQRLILPGVNPTPTPVAPASAPTATPVTEIPATYIVQPGDTLFGISVRFGVNVGELLRMNPLADPNRIFVGQTLTLR